MALTVYLRKEDVPKDLEIIDNNIVFDYDLYNGMSFDDKDKDIINKVERFL